jgi:hypothetical protein
LFSVTTQVAETSDDQFNEAEGTTIMYINEFQKKFLSLHLMPCLKNLSRQGLLTEVDPIRNREIWDGCMVKT